MKTVKSIYSQRTLSINLLGDGVVMEIGSTPDVVVSPADLLDAIRTELNVIVIDKAELPEVTVANDDRFVEINGESYGIKGLRLSREFHEQEAREHLALLRWLDENPPTDPKVEALADLISTIGGSTLGGGTTPLPIDFATRLLATGRIDIKDPS